LSETDNFKNGLLRVVNLGGDSDVQGALFGQLAGTLYGIDAIPKAWRAALLRRDLLETTAQRLLSAAAARPG
jgi:ADP-ribosyl-[dinitrogen reductase] hydrolase